MDYQYLKALHIIFVVSWFAGLFYIPRLFIYFVEANEKEVVIKKILQEQFVLMQKRLWFGITWPAMIGTYIFGFWMIYQRPFYLDESWMYLKLLFIFILTLYHFQCGRIRKQQQNGVIKYSSIKLRLFNEVATVILVAIVFLVEFQNTLNWLYGLLGLILFVLVLLLAINIYKKLREKTK